MRKFVFVISVLVLSLNLMAQKGEMFPRIAGHTMADEEIALPDAAKGKFTIVGLAFSAKAQEDLNSWATPFYDEFMNKNNLGAQFYDVNTYLVAMFVGINKAGFKKVEKKMRKSVDKAYFNNIVLYKGDFKPYKQALHIKKKDAAWIYVLDEAGKVIYSTSGSYSRARMDAMTDLL